MANARYIKGALAENKVLDLLYAHGYYCNRVPGSKGRKGCRGADVFASKRLPDGKSKVLLLSVKNMKKPKFSPQDVEQARESHRMAGGDLYFVIMKPYTSKKECFIAAPASGLVRKRKNYLLGTNSAFNLAQVL